MYRKPFQNDLEPLLAESGFDAAATEVLLQLALGPASPADLAKNAKLLPGEDPEVLVRQLVHLHLITQWKGSGGRYRLVKPALLRQRIPGPAGERLAFLLERSSLDFVPAIVFNPALPLELLQNDSPTLLTTAFRTHLPQVELKVQSLCNLSCQYCFIRKNPKDTLNAKSTTAALRRAQATGTRRLILTGGEATLRKDLPVLIHEARGLGFVDIQLFTNGLMFAYQDILAACVQAGLTSLCLHVSSLDREIYHRLTGRDHQPTLLIALENLKRFPNLEVTVLTVINRLNLGDLSQTIARLRAWQRQAGFVRFLNHLIFCCIYASSWDNRKQIVLPMEDTLPIIRTILQQHRDEPWPIVHQGFPFCVLPGLKTLSYDLYMTLARQILPGGEFDLTFLDTMFIKPRSCLQCSCETYCLGIARGYARLFGTGLLRPSLGDNL